MGNPLQTRYRPAMTRSRQSTPEQRVAFGMALKEAAEAAGVGTTTALSAYLTANGLKASQTTISQWFRGNEGEPSRPQVLQIEELLDLPVGTLSSRLGWVPVGANVDDAEAAVLADPRYSPAKADAIIAIMRTLREQ